MDPVSISAAVTYLLTAVDWKKLTQSLATDAVSKTAKGLRGRFKPDEREKAAKQALELFAQEEAGGTLNPWGLPYRPTSAVRLR